MLGKHFVRQFIIIIIYTGMMTRSGRHSPTSENANFCIHFQTQVTINLIIDFKLHYIKDIIYYIK